MAMAKPATLLFPDDKRRPWCGHSQASDHFRCGLGLTAFVASGYKYNESDTVVCAFTPLIMINATVSSQSIDPAMSSANDSSQSVDPTLLMQQMQRIISAQNRILKVSSHQSKSQSIHQLFYAQLTYILFYRAPGNFHYKDRVIRRLVSLHNTVDDMLAEADRRAHLTHTHVTINHTDECVM